MHDGVGSNRHTDGPSCGDDEVLICLSKQDRVYVTQNTRLSDVKKNLVYDFKYTGLLYLVTSNSNIKTTRDLYCTLWIVEGSIWPRHDGAIMRGTGQIIIPLTAQISAVALEHVYDRAWILPVLPKPEF